MDSVRHGGNFDGAAGVACAMAALHRLVRHGCEPERPYCMCIRAEEIVWFPAITPVVVWPLGSTLPSMTS